MALQGAALLGQASKRNPRKETVPNLYGLLVSSRTSALNTSDCRQDSVNLFYLKCDLSAKYSSNCSDSSVQFLQAISQCKPVWQESSHQPARVLRSQNPDTHPPETSWPSLPSTTTVWPCLTQTATTVFCQFPLPPVETHACQSQALRIVTPADAS